MAQHLVGAAALDDAARLHHDHAVGDLGDDVEVVGDEEHARRVPAAQLVEQAQHLRLRGDVERGCRLVGDDEARLHRQRHRDHHALALTARELVRVRMAQRLRGRQVHVGEQLEHPGGDLAARHRRRMELERLGDLVADAHHRIECGHRLLEHHRHAVAAQVAQRVQRRMRDVLAGEQDLPALERQHAGAADPSQRWR